MRWEREKFPGATSGEMSTVGTMSSGRNSAESSLTGRPSRLFSKSVPADPETSRARTTAEPREQQAASRAREREPPQQRLAEILHSKPIGARVVAPSCELGVDRGHLHCVCGGVRRRLGRARPRRRLGKHGRGRPAVPRRAKRGRRPRVRLCLLYTSPSPRDGLLSRMPSSA